MLTFDSTQDFISEVAKACDLCLKPWRHSVFNISDPIEESLILEKRIIDLTLRVECRSKDGIRFPEYDLEVEIYRSGVDLSITLSWLSFPDRPILWQGKHSVWMDSSSGLRSSTPDGGSSLEALGRKLRSTFLYEDDQELLL